MLLCPRTRMCMLRWIVEERAKEYEWAGRCVRGREGGRKGRRTDVSASVYR